MKRPAYTLIELIIALALVAILVISLMPVLSSAILQRKQLDELRLQNQFVRNLVTAIQTESEIDTDEGEVNPMHSLGIENPVRIVFRGKIYELFQYSENELEWVQIFGGDWDEPIELLP